MKKEEYQNERSKCPKTEAEWRQVCYFKWRKQNTVWENSVTPEDKELEYEAKVKMEINVTGDYKKIPKREPMHLQKD